MDQNNNNNSTPTSGPSPAPDPVSSTPMDATPPPAVATPSTPAAITTDPAPVTPSLDQTTTPPQADLTNPFAPTENVAPTSLATAVPPADQTPTASDPTTTTTTPSPSDPPVLPTVPTSSDAGSINFNSLPPQPTEPVSTEGSAPAGAPPAVSSDWSNPTPPPQIDSSTVPPDPLATPAISETTAPPAVETGLTGGGGGQSAPDLSAMNLPTGNESAPTDLTNLAAALGVPSAPTAPATSPGMDPSTSPSLTVPGVAPTLPQAPASAMNQTVVSSSKSLPKWVIYAGAAALLLIVIGASAYFILGIGKSETSPTTTQGTLTNPPKAVIPTQAPLPTTPATLDNNGSLGNLTGATSSATASVSATPTTAGSSSSGSSIFERRQATQ